VKMKAKWKELRKEEACPWGKDGKAHL